MSQAIPNAFYAQSGGVTAVINASALGVIEAIAEHPKRIAKLYAGHNGILGALKEELLDLSKIPKEELAKLYHTPGGAFGSCRYKLKSLEQHRAEYERLIAVFAAHNIRYFFYNGGGDSQDTAHKVSQIGTAMGYPITCIGIPKTVDNDLPFTDNCPGFGSVAKYIATSTLEASLDVASMAATSTKVFILEVMGRHAGWIAASSALAQGNDPEHNPPHLILFPEIKLDRSVFMSKINECVVKYGYCVIVTSEGVKNTNNKFIAEGGTKDAFGHSQLGGAAATLAAWVKADLGLKVHWAVPDYLQRSSRHLASEVDLEHAYALGKAAVELALTNHNAVMPVITRLSNNPYHWQIEHVPLSEVANIERGLPDNYIRKDGFGITQACREYLLPLIQGEAYPPYNNGIPAYARLKKIFVPKKLTEVFKI